LPLLEATLISLDLRNLLQPDLPVHTSFNFISSVGWSFYFRINREQILDELRQILRHYQFFSSVVLPVAHGYSILPVHDGGQVMAERFYKNIMDSDRA
jgi:hypothetical protein